MTAFGGLCQCSDSERAARVCSGTVLSELVTTRHQHVMRGGTVSTECGESPGGFGKEQAVVPVVPTDTVAPLEATATMLTLPGVPISLAPLVDPGCRCMMPSLLPELAPRVTFQVQLRDRNVWPSRLTVRDSVNDTILWEATIVRVDPASVGTWVTVNLRGTLRANVWRVAPKHLGGDGPIPPWHSVHVTMERDQLFGTPSASAVPLVRDVRFSLGAPEEAAVAYLSHGATSFWPRAGTTRMDGGPIVFAAQDWTTTAPDVVQVSAGCGDCGGALLLMDVAADPVPRRGGITIGSVTVTDSLGLEATIHIDGNGTALQAKAGLLNVAHGLGLKPGVTVAASMREVVAPPSFAWASVVSMIFSLHGEAPANSEVAARAGKVWVSNVRVGTPIRHGHTTDSDNAHLDDLSCGTDGWSEVSPFTHHLAVRYSHCRKCCCFFDNPADPSVSACYEHGAVIAHVTPVPELSPNDQCVTCNREVNPQVMSPVLTFFEPGTIVDCDDGESCTWNDGCGASGACAGTQYTTCLRQDFWGGDVSKDCEECDGTGPDSLTLGCTAREGHYVYVARCQRTHSHTHRHELMLRQLPARHRLKIVWLLDRRRSGATHGPQAYVPLPSL